MRKPFRPALVRYGGAILAVILAIAARLALGHALGDRFPLLTMTLAVLLVAGYAGRGPALLATALGGVIAAVRWPGVAGDSWAIQGFENQSGVVFTLVTGTGIAILGGLQAAKRRAEAAVRQADERSSMILESITDAFCSLDRQWRFVYLNLRAQSQLDRSAKDLIGKSFWDEYPTTIGTEVEANFQRAMVDRVPVVFECFGTSTSRWYEVHANPSTDGISVYFRDISERNRSDEEKAQLVAASEQQRRNYETALSNTPDHHYIFDLEGRITYANTSLLMLWQKDLAEVAGKNFFDLGYPIDLATRLDRQIRLVVATNQPVNDEASFTAHSGEKRYEYIFVPVVGTSGSVEAVAGSTREITLRKLVEEALRAQRELLRVTLSSVGDGVVTTDPQGVVTFLNPLAELLTGWANDEARGRPLIEVFRIINENSRQPVESPATRALQGREVVALPQQTILIARDGSERPIDDSTAPIRDEQGRISGVVLVFRDVTERRRQENRLRESEHQTRTILESINDAFFAVNSNWKFTYINRYAERLLNRNPGDLVGKNLWEEFPGLVGNEFEQMHRRALAEQVALSITSYYSDHDRWYEVHDYPSHDGISIYFRDVTESKRAEQRERQLAEEAAMANTRFRAFFEQGSLFASIMSVDGTILEPNRLSLESCGYSREQVVGKPFWDCPWWSRSDEMIGRIKAASELAATGQPFRSELSYYLADGTERLVDLTLLPIKDEADRVLFLAHTGTDITDRKQAETDRHKFVSLAENSTDFIGMCDLKGLFFYVNHAGLEMVGLVDVEQARRQSIRDFFDEEDQTRILEEFLPSVRDHGHAEIEIRFRHFQTGEPVWVLYSVFALTDPEGRRVGLATVGRDIHHRRQLEDNLRQSARDLLEADRRKDEFLATLAHELRNPLAPVRNGLQIMRMAGDDRAALEEAQMLMERQIVHMVRLIDDLMDVSRITRGKLELRKQRVELTAIIQSAVEASRPLVEASAHQLTVTLPTWPILMDADLTRLSQVFSNLLNNAAKYTEAGGRIALIAEPKEAEVVVTVRDNGLGIPPEMLPRVFEMFTQVDGSLERSQGGLGIGLTLVKRLVEMHGGSVEARSGGPDQGPGSEFIVRLPTVGVAPVETTPVKKITARTVEPGSGRRILVVDDNKDSARTLARLLRLMGHQTKMAHDGGEAVEVAEAYRPDLMFLDIGMPIMNGYEVAQTIRSRDWGHEVVIVALTGWGQEGDRRRSKDSGIDQHLVKPVDPTALEKILVE